MFTIYNTIKQMLVRQFSDETDEFKRGYSKAVHLLLIGIKRTTLYNYALRCHELEKELNSLKKENNNQRNEIKSLIDKLANKSLLQMKPLEVFNIFPVDTGAGYFEIIVNMDKDSFNFCLINFLTRHQYNSFDECKSKLLAFINSRSSQGFRAFKDKKAYNRYVNGKL